MTVEDKHILAVQSLVSGNGDSIASIRFIKNAVIGNPTKKNLYLNKLGVGPKLVTCLKSGSVEAQIERDPHGVQVLVQAGALEALLETLSSSDPKLVDASARALRAIVQFPLSGKSGVFKTHMTELVSLLASAQSSSPVSIHIGEVVACILARVADAPENRDAIRDSGATVVLLSWLDPVWSNQPKVQSAVLGALASLSRDNVSTASFISSMNPSQDSCPLNQMFTLVRDKRAFLRLAACQCITHIYRVGCLPKDRLREMSLLILPTIIKCFEDESPVPVNAGSTTIQERAIALFAYLVAESLDLQTLAMEGDAIVKLAAIVMNAGGAPLPPLPSNDSKMSGFAKPEIVVPLKKSGRNTVMSIERVLESSLLALASVSALKEESRRQIIDAKLLPGIVQALSHKNVNIREAACKCTRSLSRSVKNLRTSLMDAGVAEPLFNLLYDENLNVQITASATLCNIVLDFSPMKKIVLEKGGVKRLVELVSSPEKVLRLNAVWALKNMLFQTDSETKANVMAQLGWNVLASLLDDPEIQIQEQALNLLRNVACGKVLDVEGVFSGLGAPLLLDILERKLKMDMYPDLVLQDHESAPLRVASIWVVINLTWPDEVLASERIEYFKGLGVERKLNNLLDDSNGDVKERAKTALANLLGTPRPSATFHPLSLLEHSRDVPMETDVSVEDLGFLE